MGDDNLRPRLATATLERLPREVARPGYDRSAQAIGHIHFGIGAFHRAHQAVYSDAAMALGDRNWAIAGVALRTATVPRQMNPQDGLYTLIERGAGGERLQIIGSVATVFDGRGQAAAIEDAVAAASTRLLSFTITEKGYVRGLDGTLDFASAGIRNDLDRSNDPLTIYGHLRRAFGQRRAAGRAGLTLLSCDNLPANGAILFENVMAFLEASDPDLARWFAAECRCPSTMVDRIVPATTDADRASLAARTGLHDAAAVVAEPFRQWVIEDRFASERPRWDLVGAELVADVQGYELAKLRMLNAAHSAIAYLGLAAGHQFVHEAIADRDIRHLVERLMLDEAGPTLGTAPGPAPAAYSARLLERFANDRLPHSLRQIAMDGTQKLPQRWFATLADHARAGQSCPAILEALAAWICHIRGIGEPVHDPLEPALRSAWARGGVDGIVGALFGNAGLLSQSWTAGAEEAAILTARVRERCAP